VKNRGKVKGKAVSVTVALLPSRSEKFQALPPGHKYQFDPCGFSLQSASKQYVPQIL